MNFPKRIPLTNDQRRRIEWIFSYCAEHHENLQDRELNLLISYETQYVRNNWLSPRQIEVMESIYKETN